MFIRTDSENTVIAIYNNPFDPIVGFGKTEEELLEIGYLVDEIPIFEEKFGKVSILKYDGKEFYAEYVDDINTIPQEIKSLKAQNAEIILALTTGGIM